MVLILNSDILFSSRLLRGRLPRRLEVLCAACRDRRIPIIIPRTALLESQRDQRQKALSARQDIEKAYAQLEGFGIRFDRMDPEAVVPLPDLVAVMMATGAEVRIVEPTYEDLLEGHRRACLHEAPHPRTSNSDEMRDLVIWMIAVRVAKGAGSAILVSNDGVHTNADGEAEARGVKLSRARNVEEALELLEVETPAGRMISELLAPVWGEIQKAGVPVLPELELRTVRDPYFVQGPHGLAFARFRTKVRATESRVLDTEVEVYTKGRFIRRVVLGADGNVLMRAVEVTVPPETVPTLESDYSERLKALREAMGPPER